MQEDEILPPAFEAEERSWPGCGDVLQLVSGRTLLGCVRELHFPQLPGTCADACITAAQFCDRHRGHL